jgi:hypothetical protein
MPILTALTLAVTALLLIALSLNVSRLRLHHRVSLGDGGHKDLQVAVRAHGNLVEQASLFILLLLVAELCAAPRALLVGVAGTFLLARLVHAVGFIRRWAWARRAAHVGTLLAQLTLAVWLLRAALA